MRSVRCDACGSRALMAASKCPKCGHEIEVRDGFGEMLPLSHCSSCDSFYPAKLGACRWCGTAPQRAPVGPFVWKGVGIATFVAMGWGAWLVHDDPPAEVSQARLAAVLKPDSAAGSLDSSLVTAAAAPIDSIVADSSAFYDSTVVVASDSTIQSVAEVVAAISDSIGPQSATSVVAADSAPVVVEPVSQPEPATPVVTREPEPYRDPRVPRDPAPRDPAPRESRVVSEKDVANAPEPAPVVERRPVELATRAPAPTSTAPTAPSKARTTPKSTARVLAREPERTTTARTPARSSTTKPTTRASTAPKAVASAPPKSTPKSVAKAPAKSPGKAVAKAPAKSRAPRVVWVNSVARNWVIVRASAGRGSRVIASIGPNTRVQLGETRGGWRRIRAKGLAGWVEQRSFFAGAGRNAGSLAAR